MIAQNFTPVTGRSAVFIHDVLFQTNPEWFTPLERIYLAAIPHLARRACCVLTSSRSEAERISRSNPGLAPVQPVGLGVKRSLTDVRPTLPDAAGDGPFLLMVGRLNVRKNLATALRAALLSGTVGP